MHIIILTIPQLPCSPFKTTGQAVIHRINLFFFPFCLFLGPHSGHMEVPGLGVESELQLLAYPMGPTAPNLSRVCKLHHSSLQGQILNPSEQGQGLNLCPQGYQSDSLPLSHNGNSILLNHDGKMSLFTFLPELFLEYRVP